MNQPPTRHQPPATRHPPTANRQPPTANRQPPTVNLIDTHCHLDFPQFADHLDAVIKRAVAADAVPMATIRTNLDSSRAAIELTNRYPSVYATVGLHPTSIDDNTPE